PPTERPPESRRVRQLGLSVALAAALVLAGYAVWSWKQRRELARAAALYERIVERCRSIPPVYLSELDPEAICASLRPHAGPSADAIAAEVDAARSQGELVERWLSASTRLDPDTAVSLGVAPGRALTRHGPEALRERAWLTASALRKARTLGGGPVVDRTLLIRWLEYDLAWTRGLGLDARGDPGSPGPETALSGIGASYDALLLLEGTKETEFDLLADRLEQVPAVVEEVRRGLSEVSWDALERTLALLPGHRALLARWREEARDLPPASRERVEKAVRAADEALAAFRDSLVRRRERPSERKGRGSEWVHFLVGEIECSGRSIAELVAMLERVLSEGWRGDTVRYTPPEATFGTYLGRLSHAVEEARQIVRAKDLLTIPQDAPVVVEEAPPHVRGWGAAALKAFPLAELRAARIWVTPWDASEVWRSRFEWTRVSLTAAHEAYPGHHASLLVSRDKASLLRRLYPSSWTQEGWASYCEQLALEEGLAREGAVSTYLRLARAALAWGALVELAYVAGGVSAEEAVEAFVRWSAGEQDSGEARRELAFATGYPLASLGYLAGEREILELRDALRARLGARFGLKEFHDRFLAKGHTPVSQIAWELEAEWR
ncbi:MAG: DUF885 family protein, partial [Planctomycetota bacterium]